MTKNEQLAREAELLLLYDGSCSSCRHLNPHEWPQMNCKFFKDRPDIKICVNYLKSNINYNRSLLIQPWDRKDVEPG